METEEYETEYEFNGDIMDNVEGMIIGLEDYDEHNGQFESESWELDDEDGKPLTVSVYLY